ncbi:MAG: Zn-dependent exopeptidase M28 [Clostridia bacterium]|nr:Zn-dependent exopeptidase M28 [Clostridia bacterium]
MKKNSINKLFIVVSFCVVFVVSAIISGLNLFFTVNTASMEYSLENMVSHIEKLSSKKHSVFEQNNLEEMRQYIVDNLNSYGVANELVKHETTYLYNGAIDIVEECDIKNIYAEIPGSSGVNILLMAHFDSCPYKVKYGQVTKDSRGAFDDGYGVAALLEIARVYAGKTNLVNGIKFAFFDAEEVGMLGSEALFTHNRDWLNDVNIVINVEGRGNTGPVYMFETSKNNSKLIDFYKNAGFPFSFSMAADVYRMLPSNTDLSIFIENDFNSLNLATLDGLKYYHTQDDNFNNIDKNSLASYCNTLLPLMEEYTLSDAYSSMNAFDSDHDSVFFTILPNVLISYSPVVATILLIVSILLVVGTIVMYIIKKQVSIVKLIISFVIDILTIGLVFGLGMGAILLLCAMFGLEFNFMFVVRVPFDKVMLVVFLVVTFGITLLVSLLKSKLNITSSEKMLSILFINLVLLIACTIVVMGATFLFVIPILLLGVGALINLYNTSKIANIVYTVSTAVLAVVEMVLLALVVYSIFVAMSFGSLGMLLVLAVVPLLSINPYMLHLKFVEKEQ